MTFGTSEASFKGMVFIIAGGGGGGGTCFASRLIARILILLMITADIQMTHLLSNYYRHDCLLSNIYQVHVLKGKSSPESP